MTPVSRDDWRERVAAAKLTLVELADRTGKSFSTVYAYSRGARRPSDAWIARVGMVIHEYLNEWTCSACGTRNAPERHGCRACARSFDGYEAGVLRATAHGTGQ